MNIQGEIAQLHALTLHTGGWTLKARCIAAVVFITVMALSMNVPAQEYPNKPIRVVSGSAGGNTDFTARIAASYLSDSLGQQVIIDNRGAVIGPELAAKATPDGYTMLIGGGTLWTAPLMRKTSYDPIKDFSPVSTISSTPLVLAIHPSVQANSVAELIALAKAKPGSLNYASAAIGSSAHLSAELFKAMAGVNIVRVPYAGGGPALNAVVSGESQLIFLAADAVAPLLKSGRLKALAVASHKPSALLPALPTAAASGLPGFEAESTVGMFAPAKTPTARITKLNEHLVRILNRKDVEEKFLSLGTEATGCSPAEFTALIKGEMERLGKVIKAAGIKEQ